MINLIIYILLFSIYTNILFYDHSIGLNWLLYCIPLILLSIYTLSKEKRIKHKSGLLFIIPIIILSISELLYNSIFTDLNTIIIPLLFLFMYIYTIRPTFKLKELLLDIGRLIFKKFNITFIKNYVNLISLKTKKIIKLNQESKKKILSILVVIPIVIIVLSLLITADMQFKSLFSFAFDSLDGVDIVTIITRICFILFEFIFLGSFFNYLLYQYGKENYPNKSSFKIDQYTIKLLLIVLNIIYIVFDIIQIRSLFLHHVGDGIIYSEYARTGFFQLMFVSVLNIGIILLTKKSKEDINIKHLSSLLVFLTLIIIGSSFYRMYLYDTAYGYTVLRLLVYTTLMTETMLLVPTVFYIYNSKVKILKYYMIICLSVYTLMNVYSIDKIIAKNNINRYDRSKKVDIDYLVDLSEDDIPELYEFYSTVNDNEIREEIQKKVCNKYRTYDDNKYSIVTYKDRSIFEYNYGRKEAIKILDKFQCKENKE